MALTKTNTLIFICIFLLFGLFISKYFEPISIYYFLIFSLLAVIFYRFKTAFIFTVCLAAFAGGLYRGEVYYNSKTLVIKIFTIKK
jgi:hypothetical protein